MSLLTLGLPAPPGATGEYRFTRAEGLARAFARMALTAQRAIEDARRFRDLFTIRPGSPLRGAKGRDLIKRRARNRRRRNRNKGA